MSVSLLRGSMSRFNQFFLQWPQEDFDRLQRPDCDLRYAAPGAEIAEQRAISAAWASGVEAGNSTRTSLVWLVVSMV